MKIERDWILFTVQFGLRDHEDTKETGYYLLYSLHFRTMKIERDWIPFTVQFGLRDHEDTKATGYSLLYSLDFGTMKVQRRLDIIYCTVCTLGP
jgi:hypothetical protein